MPVIIFAGRQGNAGSFRLSPRQPGHVAADARRTARAVREGAAHPRQLRHDAATPRGALQPRRRRQVPAGESNLNTDQVVHFEITYRKFLN